MTPVKKKVKRFILQPQLGGMPLIPLRFRLALRYFTPQLKHAVSWALSSRECTNFTYEVTPQNCEYLAHTVSVVTGASYSAAMGYLRELQEDEDIKRHIVDRIRKNPLR